MPKKKKQLDPKCPVADCSKRLTEEWKAQCGKCGKFAVCKNHVYEHGCDKKKKAAKAAAAKTGLTVVKKGKTSNDKQDDGKAGPAVSEAEVQEMLGKLKNLSVDESNNSEKILAEFVNYLESLSQINSKAIEKKPEIITALESDSKKVNNAARNLVEKALGHAVSICKQLQNAIQPLLDTSTKQKQLGNSEENLFSNLATVYAITYTQAKEPLVQGFETVSGYIVSSKSEKIQKGAAEGLRVISKTMCSQCQSQPEYLSILKETLSKYTTALTTGKGVEKEQRRNGMAMCAGIILQALISLDTNTLDGIMNAIKSASKVPAKNDPEETLIGAMKLLNILCRELGSVVFPFCALSDKKGNSLLSVMLCKLYAKCAKSGRSEVKKAAIQLFKVVGPVELDVASPILLEALNGTAWRNRVLCLTILGQLGKRNVPGLSHLLPTLVPVVMECTRDTKKEVSETSASTLDEIASIISNPETVKLMPFLLNALKNPDKIEACLDEIMDCTFVNSIDNESLALMIPVVFRAMREGNAELKQKGAITSGNICSLVADPASIRPFVPLLLPELEKLMEHSSPNVRKFATTAKVALLEGTKIEEDRTVEKVTQNEKNLELLRQKRAQDAQEKMKNALVNTAGGKIPTTLSDYTSTKAVSYLLTTGLEDLNPTLPSRMVSEYFGTSVHVALNDLLKCLLDSSGKGLTKTEVDTLKMSLEEILFEAWLLSNGRIQRRSRHESADASTERDYIIYIPSIILAFASKMLLKRTTLRLERGHRYAFVGMNGVGKTTLLNRIAARDITGFPKSISCYYVQHEILSEDKDLTVIGYMHRLLGDAVSITEEKIQESLLGVGFNESMQETPVGNLSGGWKMRLAIARSMLYDADLLLLDEPTNHLDHAAIDWLQNHLTGLKDTTVGVVSHDYEFLDVIATDIVHINDLNLTYYDCGFKGFAKQRPEIVAALPKAEKKADDGSIEVGNADTNKEGELSALEALGLEQSDPRYQAVIKTMKPIIFPEGQKLDGITSRGKPVMSLEKVIFRYPGTDRVILNGISQRLNLNSRVALLGKNGAGKSTLLKVLIGMEEIGEGCEGKVWKHHNLRTAYIAQHSMHHLEANLEQTPCQYIQARFWEGRDKETAKMITLSLTPEEEELTEQRGEVCDVVSRVQRGKKLYYEVVINGRKGKEGNTEFKNIDELTILGKHHAVKLCKMFDEKLKASASGMDTRELTTPTMIAHLKEFGIPEDLATRKIRWMSGGQKCRLVLAAAMWTRPHLIALDEPTNYLDNETLAALTAALRSFRGGVITVSHHAGFVNALAKELWHVKEGKVTVENLKNKKAK